MGFFNSLGRFFVFKFGSDVGLWVFVDFGGFL